MSEHSGSDSAKLCDTQTRKKSEELNERLEKLLSRKSIVPDDSAARDRKASAAEIEVRKRELEEGMSSALARFNREKEEAERARLKPLQMRASNAKEREEAAKPRAEEARLAAENAKKKAEEAKKAAEAEAQRQAEIARKKEEEVRRKAAEEKTALAAALKEARKEGERRASQEREDGDTAEASRDIPVADGTHRGAAPTVAHRAAEGADVEAVASAPQKKKRMRGCRGGRGKNRKRATQGHSETDALEDVTPIQTSAEAKRPHGRKARKAAKDKEGEALTTHGSTKDRKIGRGGARKDGVRTSGRYETAPVVMVFHRPAGNE